MTKNSLRAAMPQTAAFIDECRAVFGAEMVNAQIRLGMEGATTFHAVENGIEVGTPIPSGHGVRGNELVVRKNAPPPMPWHKK